MPLSKRQKARKTKAIRTEQALIWQENQAKEKQLRWQNIHSGLCNDLIKVIIGLTPATSLHSWLQVSRWTRSEVIKKAQQTREKTWRACYISSLLPLGQQRCIGCDILVENDRICPKCAVTYPFLDTLTSSYAHFTAKKNECTERLIDIEKPWYGAQNIYLIKSGDFTKYLCYHSCPYDDDCIIDFDDKNTTEEQMWDYFKFTLTQKDSGWVAEWIDYYVDSDDMDYYDNSEECINNYCYQCLYNEAIKLFKHPVQLAIEGKLKEICRRAPKW